MSRDIFETFELKRAVSEVHEFSYVSELRYKVVAKNLLQYSILQICLLYHT